MQLLCAAVLRSTAHELSCFLVHPCRVAGPAGAPQSPQVMPAGALLPALLQDLLVHCEAQVLHFVLRYLAATRLEPQEAAQIAGEVGVVQSAAAPCWPACARAEGRGRGYVMVVPGAARRPIRPGCASALPGGALSPVPSVTWRTHPAVPAARLQVRFPFLDNATLARLAAFPCMPKQLLLEGCIQRLGTMDAPAGGRPPRLQLSLPPRRLRCRARLRLCSSCTRAQGSRARA